MVHVARLAVLERSARFSPAFERLLRALLHLTTAALDAPARAPFHLPAHSVNALDDALAVEGVAEYLEFVGFVSGRDGLTLPAECDRREVRAARDALARKLLLLGAERPPGRGAERKTPSVPPSTSDLLSTENAFVRRVEREFARVLVYEDARLQAAARACVPLLTLQARALHALRARQRDIKRGSGGSEGAFEMALLAELVAWFKESFFSWVDRPPCRACAAATVHLHNRTTTVHGDTCRVERYRCEACGECTEFVRYNDPGRLLRTRAGRCGEWANCFALICRSLGYDTRYVVDTTDHVWCEVYDACGGRWVHVDPCEAAVDAPLMYEHGWGKRLEYVLAYSRDDVQDVTWRYSGRHAAVRARRRRCGEAELAHALPELRAERHRRLQLSPARVRYLQLRTLRELVQLMLEKKPSDYESVGRTSGSTEWRRVRGELGTEGGRVWRLDAPGTHTVTYCSVADEYRAGAERVRAWRAGVWRCTNIRRNVEKDWKMVYLARIEGSQPGEVCWRVEAGAGVRVAAVRVRRAAHEFHGATVRWTLSADDRPFTPLADEEDGQPTTVLLECRSVVLRATLSGGSGDVAWQYAQLFRLPLASPLHALAISVDVVKHTSDQ